MQRAFLLAAAVPLGLLLLCTIALIVLGALKPIFFGPHRALARTHAGAIVAVVFGRLLAAGDRAHTIAGSR